MASKSEPFLKHAEPVGMWWESQWEPVYTSAEDSYINRTAEWKWTLSKPEKGFDQRQAAAVLKFVT